MSLINIIVPTYNNEMTIEKTIASLQNSGLKDFSLIIINDGSSDRTDEICLGIVSEYDNVKYVSQENKGVAAARNKGIDIADGDYVIFFDADDSVDIGSFTHAEAIISKEYPDMLIYGMCFDFYHNGVAFRTEKKVYPLEVCYTHDQIKEHFYELYESNALTSSCNKIIKRSILEHNDVHYVEGMFLMEDFLFSLDCITHCKNVYMLPESIYRYHQAEDEGNVYRRIKRINNLTEFVQPFRDRLEGQPQVFSAVYYMLLNQKLWMSNIKEIEEIAGHHIEGEIVAFEESDKKIDKELRSERYQ